MTTILLIEDDQAAASLWEIALKREGYQVITAKDGLQGLKLAQAQRPDLVLLDLMLPGIDGFEICNRLRSDSVTADIPILIISAKSQESDKRTAFKLGATAYFVKPFAIKELIATIRETLIQKPAAALPTMALTFVGARGSEASPIVASLAVALAGDAAAVNLVDLRPYSVEHSLALGLPPRPAPIVLTQGEPYANLPNAMAAHPSGARLLNNLEGSGEAGQITPADVRAVLEVLLAGGGYTLIELALYPVELLREAVGRCTRVVLVTALEPAALAAAATALTVFERLGIAAQRTALIVSGATDQPLPDWGRKVLGVVPPAADATPAALRAIAERLRGLNET